MSTTDLERLARAVERRIDEMGAEYKEIADAARMSIETLSRIRRGHSVAPRTYRKLEPALGWATYSAEGVLNGLEPELAFTAAAAHHNGGSPPATVVADLFERMGLNRQGARDCIAHLCEEVGELAKATRTGDRANLAEEVGDVGILLHRIAALYGVDVDQAIRAKAASRLERHRDA